MRRLLDDHLSRIHAPFSHLSIALHMPEYDYEYVRDQGNWNRLALVVLRWLGNLCQEPVGVILE